MSALIRRCSDCTTIATHGFHPWDPIKCSEHSTSNMIMCYRRYCESCDGRPVYGPPDEGNDAPPTSPIRCPTHRHETDECLMWEASTCWYLGCDEPATHGVYDGFETHCIAHAEFITGIERDPDRDNDLNERQLEAFRAVVARRQNVFITGPAGVGKSFCMRRIIKALNKSGVETAVTASTGVAATHIEGTTLHSFAGVGLAKGALDAILAKVHKSQHAMARWASTEVLIIDEISMVEGALLTALDAIARDVRNSNEPFGGIQLVLCGDFLQLPPVKLTNGFAFQSPAWAAANITTIELTEVVRQDNPRFIRVLNELRVGICRRPTTKILANCHISVRGPPPDDGIMPTRLYCTRKDVHRENNDNLETLDSPLVTIKATDVIKPNQRSRAPQPDDAMIKQTRRLMNNKAPSELPLKVGAQVMLTRNWKEHRLVNGSRGVVVSLDLEHIDARDYQLSKGVEAGMYLCPTVRFDNGATVLVPPVTSYLPVGSAGLVRTYLPIQLAWAITVHKSQGMTLTRAAMSLGDAFSEGQVYVALSRVKSLDGLWLDGAPVTPSIVSASRVVLQFLGYL
jgi:ATP-dependent DNA helicase PIF1